MWSWLLVNQKEPTMGCPGFLDSLVLTWFSAWPDSQISFGIGPLATVCVCVSLELQTEVIAESMEHCRFQLWITCLHKQTVFSWEVLSQKKVPFARPIRQCLCEVLRGTSLVHNKVKPSYNVRSNAQKRDVAKTASLEINSPVIHFRWTVPKRKENILYWISLYVWKRLSLLPVSCAEAASCKRLPHAGAVRDDVADHAADAATVRDAVNKVASGVTRLHLYWLRCW